MPKTGGLNPSEVPCLLYFVLPAEENMEPLRGSCRRLFHSPGGGYAATGGYQYATPDGVGASISPIFTPTTLPIRALMGCDFNWQKSPLSRGLPPVAGRRHPPPGGLDMMMFYGKFREN